MRLKTDNANTLVGQPIMGETQVTAKIDSPPILKPRVQQGRHPVDVGYWEGKMNSKLTFLATMTLIGSVVVAVAQSPPAPTLPLTAADRSSPVAPSGKQAAPGAAVTTSPNEILTNTVLQFQPASTPLRVGFNLAFQTSLTCPSSVCSFEFDDMIQVGLSRASSNRWAICGKVDGMFINPCAIAGFVATDHFETRVSLQSAVVSGNAHNVQVFVYVDSPATLGISEAIYRVYFNR
jgi:hypothetical protein